MSSEPFVSAVVELRPQDERQPLSEPDPMGLSDDLRVIGRAKAHFVSAGFEVEAPLGLSFSIAAPRSVFEREFGKELVIDDDSLAATVKLTDGTMELPTDALPPEIRADLRSIAFIAPPSFLG